jgi:hypothetical protein
MEKETYEPDDILCDMHDGWKGLPNNLEVVHAIRFNHSKSSHIVQMLNNNKHPGNKYLVVVGNGTFGSNLVAAYSYDANFLGIVELRYKTTNSLFEEFGSDAQTKTH